MVDTHCDTQVGILSQLEKVRQAELFLEVLHKVQDAGSHVLGVEFYSFYRLGEIPECQLRTLRTIVDIRSIEANDLTAKFKLHRMILGFPYISITIGVLLGIIFFNGQKSAFNLPSFFFTLAHNARTRRGYRYKI